MRNSFVKIFTYGNKGCQIGNGIPRPRGGSEVTTDSDLSEHTPEMRILAKIYK
jgi:hypothetical protein